MRHFGGIQISVVLVVKAWNLLTQHCRHDITALLAIPCDALRE